VKPTYLLDTNIVSCLLRSPSPADLRLSQIDRDRWCISAVTRGELRFGLALKPEATRLRQKVEAFLEASQTAPWDQEAADCFGRVRAQLHQKGQSIGFADEMIAAHALALGCTLVTDNLRHFQRVAGLRLENWLSPS